jgi:LysM repeat protein
LREGAAIRILDGGMVKALIILLLAAVVFGGAAYYINELYIKPDQELRAEKARGPEPPPPDPSLPELEKCLALKKNGDLSGARTALLNFIERYQRSSKIDVARDALGEINTTLFFSPTPDPSKQIYIVAKGDVLTRVAMRTRTTPELIYRTNHMNGIMLRIGQKLVIPASDFSAVVNLKAQKLTLFNGRQFFKQYRIAALPPGDAAKKPEPKRPGKVVAKTAVDPAGTRVTFQDRTYLEASHEVTISIPGHSFYTVGEPTTGKSRAPAKKGLGFAREDLEEIAVLLKKNDPVTIE